MVVSKAHTTVGLLCCLHVMCFGILGRPVVHAADAEAPAIPRVFPAGGQRGQTVNVELQGKPGTLPLQMWTSSELLTGSVAEDGKSATITIDEAATPEIHWMRIFNAAGTTDLLPFVVGTVPEITETEPNDRVVDARSVETASVVINGVLGKSGDVDCAAIPLVAGQTLVASVEANANLGSPMDAVLQLLGPDGRVLDQNDDDRGFDPLIVMTAPADGVYFVRLFAFPATPNSTIRFAGGDDYVYRLTLSTEEFLNHAMPLAVVAGNAGQVRLHGWNLREDRVVTAQSPTADEKSVAIATSAAGALLVDIVNFPSAREAEFDSTSTLPFAVSGCISEPGEVDTFRFRGAKSQQVELSVVAREKDSLLDPVLALKKADGSLVKEADDIEKNNLDTRLSIALPDDGEYLVEVADRFGHAGERYYYLVKCVESQPEFSLSVASGQFTIAAGTALELPVTIDRRNGFADAIRVTADGLPEGITCEAVESATEGDTSKSVTLTLSSTLPDGFTGTFTIVGTQVRAGESDDADATEAQVSLATATVRAKAATVTLWLTAVPLPQPEAAATASETH